MLTKEDLELIERLLNHEVICREVENEEIGMDLHKVDDLKELHEKVRKM